MSLLAALRSSGCELFNRRDSIWQSTVGKQRSKQAKTNSVLMPVPKKEETKTLSHCYTSQRNTSAYFWLLLVLKNGVFGSGWRKIQQFVGRQLWVLFNDTWINRDNRSKFWCRLTAGTVVFSGSDLVSSASGRRQRSWPRQVMPQSS